MSAMSVDFSSFNNHHHLDNISGYWDGWCQNGPPSFTSLAVPPQAIPDHNLLVEPALQPTTPLGFVSPGRLQSFITASTSPVSVQAAQDETFTPITKSKRSKPSRDIQAITHPFVKQHNATDDDLRWKSAKEPSSQERNRIAAAKCRAKSKAAEEVLKEKQRIERERNQVLRIAFEELTHEVLALKHELFCHSECNNTLIDNHLRRSADQIGREMSISSASPGSSSQLGCQ